MTKKNFPIVGMHCASCKALIEQLVSELPGVSHVVVNYAAEKMSVEYDPEKVDVDLLKKTVASAGSYTLVDTSEGKTVLASPPEAKKLEEKMMSMPKMDHDMAHMDMEKGQHDHGIPLDEQLRKKLYDNLKSKVISMTFAILPFLIVMLWMSFGNLFGFPDLMMIFGDLTFENAGVSVPLL